MSKELIRCKTCLNDSYDQGISFDERGVCCYCKKYDHDMKNYYYVNKGGNLKFNRKIEEIKRNRTGKYDCIIGLSGGVDSSYLAYILKEYDLNVLAVHVDAGWNTELSVSNIQKIIDYTNFDLETIVIDWDEIRRLQLACLRAEIMNQDIPQDHAFFSSLYNYAKKENIKYVLTGSNMQTEGILGYYGHSAMDSRYLKDVFKKYKHYKNLAKRLGYKVRTKFSWEAMVHKLDDILKENLPEFPEQVELTLPKLELPKLEKL